MAYVPEGLHRGVMLSVFSLIGSVVLSYIFLFNNPGKEVNFTAFEDRKTRLIIFVIAGYCIIMFLAFFSKTVSTLNITDLPLLVWYFNDTEHGISQLKLFIALLGAIFIYSYRLNSKLVLILNVIVLCTQVIVLYQCFKNWNIQDRMYEAINPFFSSTNVLSAYAVYSLTVIILSISTFFEISKVLKELYAIVGLNVLFSFLIIILSFSRGGIISVGTMLIYLIGSTLLFPSSNQFIKRFLIFLILLAIIIGVYLIINPFEYAIIYFDNINKAMDFSWHYFDRFIIWKYAFDQIRESACTFFFGMREVFSYLPFNMSHAHNSYIEMVRIAGIFSFFFFFTAICIALLRKGFGFFTKNNLSTGVLIMLLAINFVDDHIIWPNLFCFPVFWAMLECCRPWVKIDYRNNKIFPKS